MNHAAAPVRTSAKDSRSLGFYVPRSTFPADRGQILCEARRAGAPDDVVAEVRRLPAPPARFSTLEEVADRLRALER